MIQICNIYTYVHIYIHVYYIINKLISFEVITIPSSNITITDKYTILLK